MNSIHQLIATHCTYGTPALERRQGEAAERVLGYSVRASSLEGGTLASWYRKIERLLYYYLPRDAPSDAKLQLTAASAPKRLIYLPALDALEVMAQLCYRPTDTAGRPGSYFAHCVLRPKDDAGDPWSVLDCLKLWGAPRWIEQDSAAIPHRLECLSMLGELLDGRRPAIDEGVVLSFLTAAAGGPFDDAGSVIPQRWRQQSPGARRELFTAVLGHGIEIGAGRSKALLIAGEPSLAALLWFGILRLLPRLAGHPELGFSTFETDVDRRRFTLSATCFQKPDESELPAELHKAGPALAAVNTYRNTRSTPPSNVTEAQGLLDTLVRGGWEAVDARNRPKAAKTIKRTVDPYYEWLGIPPKDQPPNHYRLLGLELFEENRNVIDTAANRQMSFIKEYQAGEDSELSQKLLNELAAARLCMLTPEKKAAYDQELRATLLAREPPVLPARPAGGSRWRTEPVPAEREAAGEPPPPPSIPRRSPVTPKPVLPPASDGLPHASPVAATAFEPPAPGPDSGASPMIVEPSLPSAVGSRPSLLPRSKTKVGAMAVAAGVVGAAGLTLLAFVLASAFGPKTSSPAPSAKTPDPTTSGEPMKSPPQTPAPAIPVAPNVASAPSSPETTKVAERVEAEPSPPQQPVVTPLAEPPAELPVAPPAPPPAETLEQAAERLKIDAEQAASPAQHEAVARKTLALADQAILDSRVDLAKRLAGLALAAARKSPSADLVKQATLLCGELEQPLTDAVKEKARQRLSERGVSAAAPQDSRTN